MALQDNEDTVTVTINTNALMGNPQLLGKHPKQHTKAMFSFTVNNSSYAFFVIKLRFENNTGNAKEQTPWVFLYAYMTAW